MTCTGGIGCALIGLGPCIILFIFTVVYCPIKVILFTASAFSWLVALLISSMIWYLVVPLRNFLLFGLIEAVIVQEILRFLFHKLITIFDACLVSITNNDRKSMRSVSLRYITTHDNQSQLDMEQSHTPNSMQTRLLENQDDAAGTQHISRLISNTHESSMLNHVVVAYVAGMGFAFQTGIVQFLPIIVDSFGPGIETNYWESQIHFLVAACESMCMSLLQIFWTLILFLSFNKRAYSRIVLVYLTHLGLSCLSILNTYPFPSSEVVASIYMLSLIGTIILAYFLLHTECRPALGVSVTRDACSINQYLSL